MALNSETSVAIKSKPCHGTVHCFQEMSSFKAALVFGTLFLLKSKMQTANRTRENSRIISKASQDNHRSILISIVNSTYLFQ